MLKQKWKAVHIANLALFVTIIQKSNLLHMMIHRLIFALENKSMNLAIIDL